MGAALVNEGGKFLASLDGIVSRWWRGSCRTWRVCKFGWRLVRLMDYSFFCEGYEGAKEKVGPTWLQSSASRSGEARRWKGRVLRRSQQVGMFCDALRGPQAIRSVQRVGLPRVHHRAESPVAGQVGASGGRLIAGVAIGGRGGGRFGSRGVARSSPPASRSLAGLESGPTRTQLAPGSLRGIWLFQWPFSLLYLGRRRCSETDF